MTSTDDNDGYLQSISLRSPGHGSPTPTYGGRNDHDRRGYNTPSRQGSTPVGGTPQQSSKGYHTPPHNLMSPSPDDDEYVYPPSYTNVYNIDRPGQLTPPGRIRKLRPPSVEAYVESDNSPSPRPATPYYGRPSTPIGRPSTPIGRPSAFRDSPLPGDSPPSPASLTVPLPTTRKQSRVQERINRPSFRRRQKGVLLPGEMHYGVEDVPPWYLCILLGFQHYLIMFGATVTNPLTVAKFMCMGDTPEDNVARSELIGTIFFVSGIITFLQATVGTRLPIVQGGTFTFVTPTIAILNLPRWKCPEPEETTTLPPCRQETEPMAVSMTSTPSALIPQMIMANMTNSTLITADSEPLWKPRMREIQGAIMIASLFQVLIGFTGLIGFVLRFIGPLAIAPTIALVGLALFEVAALYAAKQWWITLVTVVLIVAFSQYSKNIQVPCFHFKRGEGCKKVHVAVFRLFPVILAIVMTWIICAILTATKVFPSDPDKWGYGAQTNTRLDVLSSAAWFRIPYPGQWGTPTVSTAAVFGMLSGVLASMVESVGDYYACARLSGAPAPPMHAVNRGIGIEGIGCVLAGLWGHGSGTTSYSENIGVIGITRVASRRVTQTAALVMIIFGVFGKFGALFVTIPDPVVGGVFIVMFGMITAVGISNLQFVDLNSSRNLFIIGFSLFFGLTLPNYVTKNPGAIATGVTELDQVLTVLLSTSMFVGGLAGFVLDNTIPGTEEERGLLKWRQHHQASSSGARTAQNEAEEYKYRMEQCYEIPTLTRWIKRYSFTKYMPFLPTFDESIFDCCKSKSSKKKKKRRRHRREREVDDADDIAQGASAV